MIFRSKGPLIHAESGGEMFLRAMLLLAVIVAVAAAFWWQSGQALEKINARGSVWDETKILTKDQKQALRSYASNLKSEHGIKLRLHIRKNDVVLPEIDRRTLFIGINPHTQQVLIEFPPLLRKAFGDDYMYHMQNEHFAQYFAKGEWQQGLVAALGKIWDDLGR